MNKLSRLIIALILALGAVGFSASHAEAAAPLRYGFDFTFTHTFEAGEICPFAIDASIYYAVSGQGTFYENGNWMKDSFHQSEQDTYTVNGKTIATDLYHNYGYYLYDIDGNLTAGYSEGNFGRYRLPDGKVISINAGRMDLSGSGGGWSWSGENGNPGDLAAFCAFLAP